MTPALAEQITGGLSKPSKMPCPSFSIPARRCITGGKLHDVPDSICESCYALRGNYNFPVVRNAMERRFKGLNHPQWVEAMVFLIEWKGNRFFRWHDSGDIQSVEHLQNIVKVCTLTPAVSHWLPTREVGILGEYKRQGGTFPDNLTLRLSAFMVDQPAPKTLAEKFGCVSSVVVNDETSTLGKICPAFKQGGKCLTCRACWDKGEEVVAYVAH